MNKIILIVSISVFCISLYAQPPNFTWFSRHGDTFKYITPPKDQKEIGPCNVFAAVAAVEAMAHIYYNKYEGSDPNLNLSERLLYTNSGDCGVECTAAGVDNALTYFKEEWVIDDGSFEFPADSPFCRSECYEDYIFRVSIPEWSKLTNIYDNEDLQKAIMDFGPIIVNMPGEHLGYKAGCLLHPGDTCVVHSVLIIGWESYPVFKWHIKDSWQGSPTINYFEIDLFLFSPNFYRVYAKYNNDKIECDGDNCSLFTSVQPLDRDEDGFFNWGLDSLPPDGWTGINKMDYDDGDPNTIFRDGYDPLPAPYIYDTISKYVCPVGRIFTLKNFDNLSNLGFSVSWTVSPSGYFSSSPSGNNDTATVTPIASYLGKQCKIEFNLSYNSALVKTYKFEFIISGPREDLVSMSVLDSYGGSPPGSGDMYYLCPNTTYNIYYNNYDNNCQTSNFVWDLPYGWTKYWDYGHILSINTNDYPYGLLDVKANHCCADSIPVKVYSLYFAEADCGEYFMAYPNPSSEFVDIDVVKDKISSEELISDIKTYLSIVDKSGTVRLSTSFKGFPYRVNTSDLPDGIYFMNIQFKDKISSIRLVIKH